METSAVSIAKRKKKDVLSVKWRNSIHTQYNCVCDIYWHVKMPFYWVNGNGKALFTLNANNSVFASITTCGHDHVTALKQFVNVKERHWLIEGGSRDAPPGPNSFIFMQFSAKNLQNNRLAHPLWELAQPSGKSWIRHWWVFQWNYLHQLFSLC